MRTLIIGKVWPEPASSAAGKRSLDLIGSLAAAGWEIHFASAAQLTDHSADLDAVRTHEISLNDSGFDSWLAALAPEIVIFDRFMTEEQFGWRVAAVVPEALRVIDTIDLHCLREARRESLNTGAPLEPRNAIALREIASLLRSDLSLMISEYEIAFLGERFGIAPPLVAYWPFLLEEPPAAANPGFESRQHCLMIGNFLHEPNWDAVRWCLEAIWPTIRAALPGAELHVYGSYEPPKARQLDNPALGFRLRGRAEDAVAAMRAYRLNLAPLRFGAGLKGKIADGFIAGTPNIATPIAAEAMNGPLPWGSPIEADPRPFARAAIDLYRSPEKWALAQESGYEIARRRFSSAAWKPELPKILADAFENRGERRQANFTGQLLRHHQHRSTEYMSRWIEAKNQPRTAAPPTRV